jgi:hypothetical protein
MGMFGDLIRGKPRKQIGKNIGKLKAVKTQLEKDRRARLMKEKLKMEVKQLKRESSPSYKAAASLGRGFVKMGKEVGKASQKYGKKQRGSGFFDGPNFSGLDEFSSKKKRKKSMFDM